MNLTEFLAKIEFTPYGSVVNSWDSFNKEGSVLMQLWAEPDQRVHSHQIEGAYGSFFFLGFLVVITSLMEHPFRYYFMTPFHTGILTGSVEEKLNVVSGMG